MTASDKQKNQQASVEKSKPGEFVIGIITFIIFLIFMTLWMYFGTAG